jgi:hypothetical protein
VLGEFVFKKVENRLVIIGQCSGPLLKPIHCFLSSSISLGRKCQEKQRRQSSLFEQEQQRRLRIPVDCGKLRMNVPLQRQRRGLR